MQTHDNNNLILFQLRQTIQPHNRLSHRTSMIGL